MLCGVVVCTHALNHIYVAVGQFSDVWFVFPLCDNVSCDATRLLRALVLPQKVGSPIGEVRVCVHGWGNPVQKGRGEGVDVEIFTHGFQQGLAGRVETWTSPDHVDNVGVIATT